MPKVAIIYLSFHSEQYLDDAVSALKKMTYPRDRAAFVVVDNPHPEYGSSVRAAEETLLPLSEKEIPRVVILPQEKNLGFAGGNNVGMQWALDNGFDFVFLHNDDGFMASDCLERLVEVMEKDKTIGAAQSLLLMHPETELINSDGNSFHYLGFGFCNHLRVPKSEIKIDSIKDIGYASGAAVLMRADLLKQHGLWDDDFFLYHEDLEYSLRLKQRGYRVVLAPASVFYHKYNFGRNTSKYYYMERNRYGVMLMYMKIATLVLLLPIALAVELGILLLAAKNGWLKEKISAYGYWLKATSWKLWLKKRVARQGARKVKDKDILRSAESRLIFAERSFQSPLLKYFGNPIMAACWFVAKKIIFW
ncbi:glycosyltransferase family 2 protein [Patescibacteria group bacterium]|nr:MAG: glycosyltransferase family 2 protein [Patescibacteria group bacterium]